MFSNKLPDTKSRIFGSSNESSSLYARLSEVTASLTRNKQSDHPESNGLPPIRGKMPSSRQKSNTLPHLGHGPQVQQLYDDDARHHKIKEEMLPKVNSQQGDHSKVSDSIILESGRSQEIHVECRSETWSTYCCTNFQNCLFLCLNVWPSEIHYCIRPKIYVHLYIVWLVSYWSLMHLTLLCLVYLLQFCYLLMTSG